MNIIPAIDLHEGQCVRLLHGDFSRRTRYAKDPVQLAQHYERSGFTQLHVVDLDGARTGKQQNRRIVENIVEATSLKIQLGGGIRARATIAEWLDAGVARCVVGSIAATNPEEVRAWMRDFGANRVVAAFDVRTDDDEPKLSIHGWTDDIGVSLWSAVDAYIKDGLQQVLCTDIACDGALSGPASELYEAFKSRYPDIELQASGGVSGINDLNALKAIGAESAIVGRALLDGRITELEIRSFLRAA